MSSYEFYEKMKDIELMCKIALTHATPGTRKEIVGRCSGRTIEDMFLAIKSISGECMDAIKKDMGW